MSLLLVLVVREFGGPNSFLVGENLMSPYPYLVSMLVFAPKSQSFDGLSIWFTMYFGRIFSFSLSQMELTREFVSSC